MREMKDSGIEWIGRIPIAWKLNKIGAIYEERNTKVSDSEYEPLSVTKQGIVPQLETAAKTDNGDNRKLILKNDFVINSRSDRRGSCGISEYDGSCSLINTVLKPRGNMNNKYYSFVFKSDNFADEFYRWGHGIVNDLWSTKWSDMKNIYIPSPTIDEQKRIADYLDEKCAKIDTIIEKQQEIIEKLKEYKISVITEAVTKGLNTDVKIKDSGIECIGKIPIDWTVNKFKHMSIEIGDGLHGTPDYDSDGDYYFINGQNIGEEELVFTEKTDKINEGEYRKYKQVSISQNTIFITLNGATYGKTSFYNGEKVFLGKSAGYITFKDEENKRFIRYYLQSHAAKTIMDLSLCGSTIANLSLATLNEFCIPLPCEKEQIQIVNFLDKKCSTIEEKIIKKEETINKLSEYKKSIIYEVVTGKREV
ncbi:MAG: type I restriction endonuclease subunit S [Lachnospiraceae bacterium]|nr:type I restriction endonuclease subunit S [Lachnospiraceae bacterium]